MNYLKLMCVAFLSAVVLIACLDDDKDGSVRWDRESLFMAWGETVTVGVGGDNISAYSIASVPEGWDTPEVDTKTMSVAITAPAASGEEIAASGTVKLRGTTHGGELVYANLFVSLDTPEVDFAAEPANSYIATKPGALYRINGKVKGDGSPVATASVAVLWQTSTNLLRYLQLEDDGTVTFFIPADGDNEEQIKEGNALLGAFDQEDNLVWSWHIWATDYDAEAESLAYGDYTMMSRALGQLENSTADQTATLASYGLYYQWGRKDPFAGPSTYNASKGTTASLYNGESNLVNYVAVESDSETGNYPFTNSHPMHFVTVSDKNEAWDKGLTTDVRGWNSTEKSVNDPCPYGWRVAPAEAFEGLTIVDDLSMEDAATKYAEQYGWTLAKNGIESFYFAGGRRVYADALIQNVFDESLTRNGATEAQPWVGYNWTAEGTCFAFWFNKQAPTESSLRNDLRLSTANGMMVRCVKE